MPDNQHRKLYSKTYYSRQANLHYAECSRGWIESIERPVCRNLLFLFSYEKKG